MAYLSLYIPWSSPAMCMEAHRHTSVLNLSACCMQFGDCRQRLTRIAVRGLITIVIREWRHEIPPNLWTSYGTEERSVDRQHMQLTLLGPIWSADRRLSNKPHSRPIIDVWTRRLYYVLGTYSIFVCYRRVWNMCQTRMPTDAFRTGPKVVQNTTLADVICVVCLLTSAYIVVGDVISTCSKLVCYQTSWERVLNSSADRSLLD